MRIQPRRPTLRGVLLRWVAAAVIGTLAFAVWKVGTAHHQSAIDAAQPNASAATDVLIRTDTLGSALHTAPVGDVLIGRTAGVRLLGFGAVSSYGDAASRHFAQPGYRLIAFRFAPVAGEDGQGQPTLLLRVGGNERGPLVISSDAVVASVPAASTDVSLVLDDGGVKQSISLLTGRPGSDNVLVSSRAHATAKVGISRPVAIQVRASNGTVGLTNGTFTLNAVSLSYWGADGSHPDAADRALLHIEATVALHGDKHGYGAEPELLSLSLPGGATTPTAHNAAANATAAIDAVIEVPATVTSGVVHYSGSWGSSAGTITVLTPLAVPFTIPAG